MDSILDSPFLIYQDKFTCDRTNKFTTKVNSNPTKEINLLGCIVDLNIYNIPDSTHIVICKDNQEGTPINTCCEDLSTELINIAPPPWGEKLDSSLLFIEYYPNNLKERSKFHLVQFSFNKYKNSFHSPRWCNIPMSTVQNLINPVLDDYEEDYLVF